MIDRAKLLNGIKNPDEKLFFSQAVERAYFCIKNGEPAFSSFSDPYKAGMFLKHLGFNHELQGCCFGGFEGAERVMLGFFPYFMEIDEGLFPIEAIKISYNSKFSAEIKHRDFLGAILSLGISRDKIGDIVIEDGGAVVLADNKISSYITVNLERVSNTKVKCEKVTLAYLAGRDENAVQKNITVSSLRLDAVLSAAFNLSRAKTGGFISSGKAFINWQPEQTPSKSVGEGDIITLRGEGRIKIIEIKGKTKKDRFVLRIYKYC